MFTKNKVNVTETVNNIENALYLKLKEYGFHKHGRTLHRFVSGDISQVINFQCGQSYRNETHLMWVNIGIRVPECQERSFDVFKDKKYYQESECNMRSRLGVIKNKNEKKVSTFDLMKSTQGITEQIINEVINDVLPVFEILSSRQAILEHRREYPYFDILNSHLILLEEAMIYGRMGDKARASELFEEYYAQVENKPHIEYLDELKEKLGL